MASVSSTGSATSKSNLPSGFSQMTSEDFVNVMIKQLQTQDPFKPQDSSALLEQISSIRNIESQVSMQSSLKDLVLQNQIAGAGNLIGKTVQGLDDTNNQVSGVVTAVRVKDNKAILELDSGHILQVNRVTAMTNTTPAAA